MGVSPGLFKTVTASDFNIAKTSLGSGSLIGQIYIYLLYLGSGIGIPPSDNQPPRHQTMPIPDRKLLHSLGTSCGRCLCYTEYTIGICEYFLNLNRLKWTTVETR